MSSIRKHFIEFEEFAPDSRFLSGAKLHRAESALPIFGNHRPCPQIEQPLLPNTMGNRTPSGLYVHLSSEETGLAFAYTVEDTDPDNADSFIFPDNDIDRAEAVGGNTFDDATYIYFVHGDVGVAQSTLLKLSDVTETLDALQQVQIRLRAQAVGADIGNYSIRVQLGDWDGATFTPYSTGSMVENETGPDAFWVQHIYTAAAGSVPDGVDVYLMIEVTFDDAATQEVGVQAIDLDDGWWSPWGGVTPPEDAFDDDDDDTGAEALPIPAGESKRFRVLLDNIDPGDIITDDTPMDFVVRARGEVTGMNLKTRIETKADADSDFELVSELDHGGMTDAMADYTHSLTAQEKALITNWSLVYLTAEVTGAQSSGTQKILPTDDLENEDNYWTKQPGNLKTDLWQALDDDTDETDYIETPNDTVLQKVAKLEFDPGVDPGVYEGVQLVYRISGSPTNTGRCAIKLTNAGQTLRLTSGQLLKGSPTTITVDLESVASTINWAQPFELEFYKNTEGPSYSATVYWAKIETAGVGAKAWIAEMGATYPASSQVRISWAEVEYPLQGQYQPGDQLRPFIGNEDIIYEVVGNDYTQRGTGYVNTGPEKSWWFTSWGNRILATNYADSMQMLEEKAATFVNLVDMTDTDYTDKGGVDPRGKYLYVVGSQLCLANVDEASYVDGRPYTVWCSAMGNPRQFFPADYATQSTFFQLVSTPGSITCAVGGERGTVFKKNSILRQTYVGYPPIFNFDVITQAQGTPYPRSVVIANQDIYFFGNGGIFRLDASDQLHRLGVGTVEKYLFDYRYEEFALKQFVSYDEKESDALVMGGYDAYSGLIFWPYATQSDPPKHCSRILVYSPKEDKFAIVSGASVVEVEGNGEVQTRAWEDLGGSFQVSYPYKPDICAISGSGNFISSETSIVKGFHSTTGPVEGNLQADYQKFKSKTSMPMVLTTERIPSTVFADESGLDVELLEVRPIARIDGNAVPEIGVAVYASETPTIETESSLRVVGMADRNSDGWMSLGKPISGEFYFFTVFIDALSGATIKEFQGLHIKYRVAGER